MSELDLIRKRLNESFYLSSAVEEDVKALLVEIQRLTDEVYELHASRNRAGRKGGVAAAAALTPEQRSARARKAANTRWHGQTP